MTPELPTHRVGAVSYLNTVPLVWGMLNGPQRHAVELTFSIPAECATQIEEGTIDIGLVPVVEIARQKLEIVPGVGIACFGPVRSILLFSRVPFHAIRTLAADASSRTSVQLARVILRERFGITPQIIAEEPLLPTMLATADAALIIGDPALRLNPDELPYEWLDLGHEWKTLTGLPMVFAAWAGKAPDRALTRITIDSYRFGEAKLHQIIESEHEKRGVTRELATQYLRNHIRFELGERELGGLGTFLSLAGLTNEKHAYSRTTF